MEQLQQMVWVVGISFVALCLVASFLRFQRLLLDVTEDTARADMGVLRMRMVKRVGFLGHRSNPFILLAVRWAEGGGDVATAEDAALALRAVLRKGDEVIPCGAREVAMIVETARRNVPAFVRRMQAHFQARALPDVRMGAATTPEDGADASLLIDKAWAAIPAAGDARAWGLAGLPLPEQASHAVAGGQAALIDADTGVLKKAFVAKYFQRFISQLLNRGRPAALVCLSVDFMGRYDETRGAGAGKAVLGSVGRILQDHLREPDLIGRSGDDEFVFSFDCATEQALAAAERLVRLIEATAVTWEGQSLRVTVSAGVAIYPAHGRDMLVLYDAARAGMLEAQFRGRNRALLFEEPMRLAARRRVQA